MKLKRFGLKTVFVIFTFSVLIAFGVILKTMGAFTHAWSADSCSNEISDCACEFCQPADLNRCAVKFLISPNNLSDFSSTQTVSCLEIARSIDYPPEIF